MSWAALLKEAVNKPGYIHEAYSRFHNYSLGNQLLALFQYFERGIQPGPLATLPKWKELGRHVKKGEKALTLCMPLTSKRTKTATAEDGIGQGEELRYPSRTWSGASRMRFQEPRGWERSLQILSRGVAGIVTKGPLKQSDAAEVG